jgi:hypothetical protein
MSLLKTYIDEDKYSDQTAMLYARIIFYSGVIGSFLDGMTTWYVLTQVNVGIEVEKNGFMVVFMRDAGVVTTCTLRILIGVIFFWLFSNQNLGKRYFFSNRMRNRYVKKIMRTDRNRIRQWMFDRRSYSYPIQSMIGLLATWAVVGNNLNAIYISIHAPH